MIRKISLSALTVSMFASLVSAGIGFDGVGISDLRQEISNMDVAAPAEAVENGLPPNWLMGNKTPKEWTIMVFVNGKNDLEPFAMKDMNEMEMVGSSDKVNIVVETGRIAGYDNSDGDWKGTRRFLMTKDKNASKVTSKVVQDLGKVDMGDYKSVMAFGNWAKANYPAKKYMLIVWNHGSGWEKGLGSARMNKGISYDEETGNHLDTPQLGLALKGMGGVNVYGSDACLMQMAEVDYELKDSVEYIVGSEETEPGDGYTYNTFLAPVVARPAMTPAELAKVAVDAYSDHYKAQREGSTQSYIKAAAVPKLLTLSNAFVSAVINSGDKALVRNARDGAMKYAIEENKDLYDFARLVVEGTKNAEVKKAGNELMTFITTELVMHNRTNNSEGGWGGVVKYSLSKGIAVYLPSSVAGPGYSALQWAKVSNWDDLITWMNQR